MGFRQKAADYLAGPQWRVQHHALLVECGIPYEVADSDRLWAHLLLHGCDPVSGWNPTWITPPQAGRLLDAIEKENVSPASHWLIRALAERRDSPIS